MVLGMVGGGPSRTEIGVIILCLTSSVAVRLVHLKKDQNW